MPSITVRNVPAEIHRALRIRAARHGRSTEAEIRDILARAARPDGRLLLGSMLAAIAEEAGGLSDAEAEQFDKMRNGSPAEPIRFE